MEAFLDELFRFRGWHIESTTPYEERVLCIGDRKFSRGGQTLCIEYKSGIQTAYTGNIFIETVSVDTQGKPGWVYTCQADYIFYAALLNRIILIFKPSRLRNAIEELKARFRIVATNHQQNEGYKTHGVVVPLDYAENTLAEKVIEL